MENFPYSTHNARSPGRVSVLPCRKGVDHILIYGHRGGGRCGHLACQARLTGPHHSGIRVYRLHHLDQRGVPLQASQTYDLLSSASNALEQLQGFLRQRREAHEPVENLETFEQELPRLFVAAEREALSRELARLDLDVPTIEVAGER